MSNDIKTWLNDLGLSQYWSIFDQNKIGLDVLKFLTDQDLRELDIPLGDRKRLLHAAAALDDQAKTKESEAEHRHLTVLFCDIVGYTQIANQVDTEELNQIMGEFESCCETSVAKFGGKIARFMGDGALVYFGYPTANEYDPERAIRTGLDITDAIAQLNTSTDVELKTRVGIATGAVVVGDLIGKDSARERRAAGLTVNLAARLESLAEPNTVLVAAATQRIVGDLFHYTDMGMHTLKGFEHKPPVQVWRVDQEADVQNRFEATRSGRALSPMLGRDAESDTLMSRWARAKGGAGQAVTVIGEPGIGKSHLIQSLRATVTDESKSILHYYCAPHQQKTALFPTIVHLGRAAGIERTDSPETKMRKLEALVLTFSEDLDQLVPLYANLLSVPANQRYPELNLSPRVQKERVLEALTQQLVTHSKKQATLVIFEDLHWMDPTSLELLERIMQKLDEIPMMLVLTARPEFSSPWSSASNSISIHLERLGTSHVKHLIEQVTNGKRLPEEVIAKIVEKTDGVPLFVEELTKTLLESEVLEETENEYLLNGPLPDHAVPSTLHDSLMARLDRQGDGKKIAQMGSAIGRIFTYEFMAKICGMEQHQLSAALWGLTQAGLVYRSGEGEKAKYQFKHALIQDAAYSTLLKKKRRALHKNIADSYQLHYPDVSKEYPEMLAHHYTHAREYVSAMTYRERAARKSIDSAAHEEAQKHISRGLEALDHIPVDDTHRQMELSLQVTRGVALESTLGYAAEEVEQAYDRARELCEKLDYKSELVPVLLGLYVFNLVRGEYLRAQALATRCVQLSNEAGRKDYQVESYAALGYIQGHLGDFKTSIATLRECISIYESRPDDEDFPNITAQDPCALSYAYLALILWLCGEVKESEDALHRAFEWAEKLDRPMNFAVVHTHAAEYYQMRGEIDLAKSHASNGINYASEFGYDSWHMCCVMHAGIAMGTLEPSLDGIGMAQQGLALLQGAGAQVNMAYFKGRTAWCLHVAQKHEEAQMLLSEAFSDCEHSKDFMHACLLYQLRGDMLASMPQPDSNEIERNYLKSVEVAHNQGSRVAELRALTSLQLWHQKSGLEQSKENEILELLQHFPKESKLAVLEDARSALQEPNTDGKIGVK